MKSLTPILVGFLLFQCFACLWAAKDRDQELKELDARNLVEAKCEDPAIQSPIDLAGHDEDNPVIMKSPRKGRKGKYPKNLDCTYKFKIPEEHLVKIFIKRFKLKRGCRGQDRLNWKRDSTPIGDPWCTTTENKIVTRGAVNKESVLTARFTTKERGEGFNIRISVEPESGGGSPNPPPPPPPPQPPLSGICGIKPKIIGGEEVSPGEFPWRVALVNEFGNIRCGGTIVDHYTVVTAAHCIGENIQSWEVIVNEHDITDHSDGQVTHKIECAFVHPEYNRPVRFNNDIALVRLEKPVNFDETAKPACLPTEAQEYDGKTLTVTGWGVTAEGQISTVLQSVDVTGQPRSSCRSSYGIDAITEEMMCASNPGKDGCQGDSGGPMTYTKNNRAYLVGVVSWGRGCAQENFPGVYVKVDQFLDFIKKNAMAACPA